MRPGDFSPRRETRSAARDLIALVPFSAVVLVLTAAVMVGLFLYSAQFSGSLRWALGLALLAILAAFAWRQVLRRTSDLVPLVLPTPAEAYEPGELGMVSSSVRRATRGLRYSQVVVTSRARVAFLDRARLSLGMSPEAMRAVQRDPDALRRLFGDDVLADFLHIRVGDLEERFAWVLRARERGGFSREFEVVLARMEAWR